MQTREDLSPERCREVLAAFPGSSSSTTRPPAATRCRSTPPAAMHQMKALPVRRLSSILASVSAALRDRYGLTRLYVGGGSALAMLDHLFSGAALRMRDLDMSSSPIGPSTASWRCASARRSTPPELRFLPKYVYARRRTRSAREPVVAGWGALWDAHGVEVDLSMFHDDSALELNGADERRSHPHSTAARQDVERDRGGDPDDGVGRGRNPRGFGRRSVRRLRQLGATAHPPSWPGMRFTPRPSNARCASCASAPARCTAPSPPRARRSSPRGDPLGTRARRLLPARARLVKLLHDDRAVAELEMMHSLGTFSRPPEIGEVIERLGQGPRPSLFRAGRWRRPPRREASRGLRAGRRTRRRRSQRPAAWRRFSSACPQSRAMRSRGGRDRRADLCGPGARATAARRAPVVQLQGTRNERSGPIALRPRCTP